MDKRELQKSLQEIVGDNENEKRSEIPRNVDSSYKVILDLNMKGVLIAFSPFYTVLPVSLFILSILNILTIYTGLVVVFITVVVFMFIYGLLTISPIKEKQNVKMYHHILNKRRFKERQKVYFIEGRSDE